MGGGTRIPKIQETLKAEIKRYYLSNYFLFWKQCYFIQYSMPHLIRVRIVVLEIFSKLDLSLLALSSALDPSIRNIATADDSMSLFLAQL